VTDRLEGRETLRVYFDGTVLFSSEGKWLHPLFDLEEYLDSIDIDRNRLFLVDRVTGRAAALLVARMRIRRLSSGVLSRLAAVILDREGIEYRCDSLVDRIDCRTETLLESVDDAEAGYHLLAVRAGRRS
jgi:hypothetical protein